MPRHGVWSPFLFENLFYCLDASTIDLCLSVFPWANFRATKSAIKLHVEMNHDGYLPEFVAITEGKASDVEMGRTLVFPSEGIVVADRGYKDYDWYNQLIEKGIFFVTRIKVNAQYRVINRHPVLKSKGLTSDQAIRLTNIQAAKKYPNQLRRIGYRDIDIGKLHFSD